MKSQKLVQLIAFFLMSAVDALAEPIILPFNDKILGLSGSPEYVDDSVVQTKVPGLKDVGPRLSSCLSGMTIPQFLTVEYPPRIVGTHLVETNVLQCTHERESDHFECNAANPVHSRAVFDVDPDRYFSVEHLSDEESLPVIRDVLTRRLKFAEGVEDPHISQEKGMLGTLSPTANGYVIDYGDCGCSGQMLLHRNDAGEFVVTQAGIQMCI